MPRANANSCEEKVKLTLRKLGHAKCSYDRKPHEKEGMWLNDVMGEKVFEEDKMYRVFNNFVKHHASSLDHGKRRSTLRIQNNQPYSVGAVKVSVAGEEIPKISLRPTKGLQPSEVDCALSDFIKQFKLRKKFMDLSDRRRRDRIQLASQVVLKLSNAIDVSKDIKEKRDVANDVVIFIDAIKDHLVQTVLKQDLNDLSECVYHRPPNDEGEDLSAAISLL